MNPHSILVEGSTDKKILQKALNIKGLKTYGITNGHGSNIDTVASKLNDTDISLLVIVDDDKDGREYKERIKKIGGSYSADNVLTIRDLVGSIVEKGTIEDALSVAFLESKVHEVYDSFFAGEEYDLSLDSSKPSMEQLRVQLNQKRKTKKVIDQFLEELKIKLSDEFNPTRPSFASNFSLLDSLVDAIQTKLI